MRNRIAAAASAGAATGDAVRPRLTHRIVERGDTRTQPRNERR
jgi:hypothetical protein